VELQDGLHLREAENYLKDHGNVRRLIVFCHVDSDLYDLLIVCSRKGQRTILRTMEMRDE